MILFSSHFLWQIANILETAMIYALFLESEKALFVPLRISWEQPQGN